MDYLNDSNNSCIREQKDYHQDNHFLSVQRVKLLPQLLHTLTSWPKFECNLNHLQSTGKQMSREDLSPMVKTGVKLIVMMEQLKFCRKPTLKVGLSGGIR